MTPAPNSVDVLVIGGGPAGAATALRAARLGHHVCLVERGDASRHREFGQSLAPNILPVLDVLGLRAEVEAAEFPRSRGVVLLWGDGQPGYRSFEGAEGFHVERRAFDRMLRQAAMRAGAVVLRPATVLRMEHTPGQVTPWTARVSHGGTEMNLRAKFLVDASGRRPTVPAARLRDSPPLLAVVGTWRVSAAMGRDSRVEAAPDGWLWAGPRYGGHATVAVFSDPRMRRAARERSPIAACLARIAGARMLSGFLEELVGPLAAYDATSRHARDPIEADLIRVGESAVTVDPLSSQGVQIALTGAVQAAIVLNTWIRCPARSEAAIAFYRARLTDVVRSNVEAGARFYGEAAGRLDTSFWHERSVPDAHPNSRGRLNRERSVPEPSTCLRLADGACVVRAAVVRDELADFAPAIRWSNSQRDIAFVGDMPVGELAATLVPGLRAEQLVRSWSESVGTSRALEALAWMWQMGVLETAGDSTDPTCG